MSSTLIINATSSGISGDIPAIPASLIHSGMCCYDMFYQKGKTPFLAWCELRGSKRNADGLGDAGGTGGSCLSSLARCSA
nr:hypothetical protein [Escherichia coli]